MRIAVLGTGTVGEHLATGLARHGHDVTVGTREPRELPGWAADLEVAALPDAAAASELVLLCVKGTAAVEAVELADPPNLAGKVLIDVTNPLVAGPGGVTDVRGTPGNSNAERIQLAAPDARVVKCWNTVTASQMIDPRYDPPAEMLICGDDEEAKATVADLLEEVGWPALDVGPLRDAYYLETLVGLWIRVGRVAGRWDHAFRVVRPGE